MKTLTKIIGGVLAITLVATAFHGCKKGDEDPFLSLKSRDSRVTGTWTLKLIEYSKVQTSNSGGNISSTTTDIEFDGEDMTTTTTSVSGGNSSISVDVDKYSDYTLSIYKDGTYEANQVYEPTSTTSGGQTTMIVGSKTDDRSTGRWWWASSNKKKTHLAMDDDYDAPYLLKLSGKEMIWQWVWDSESQDTDLSGISTNTTSGSAKYTWEKTDKKSKK